MTQAFRRTLVWTVIAVLLLLGTLMQLKAAPQSVPPDLTAQQKTKQAVVSAFACTVSLLTFHLSQAEETCGETIALLPETKCKSLEELTEA